MNASGGFADVKSILSDIKLNLQTAESRHQTLVQQWCSDEKEPDTSHKLHAATSTRIPAQMAVEVAGYAAKARGQSKSLLRSKLPVVPSDSPSEVQRTPQAPEESMQQSIQESLRGMRRDELEALRESLEREIQALELGSEEISSAFTLVQTPI